ncbi:MAG: ATP-binding protein [Lachnospiraceae bacterium]|nr:ATP-binding protein [Lachnospiraceae bacterium]
MTKEQVFPATLEALPQVQAFFEESLEAVDCPMKLMIGISVVIEEIFVNIAHYAYPDSEGTAAVSFSYENDSRTATFAFRDSGIPFNPLAHEDPDVTLSAEERDIGGLGIFITKKTMDTVNYVYENGENCLTMTKVL